MKIQLLVTMVAVPIQDEESTDSIVAEAAKMAVLDALTEQEANGFVHPLKESYALHVHKVEIKD